MSVTNSASVSRPTLYTQRQAGQLSQYSDGVRFSEGTRYSSLFHCVETCTSLLLLRACLPRRCVATVAARTTENTSYIAECAYVTGVIYQRQLFAQSPPSNGYIKKIQGFPLNSQRAVN
jgi:hypothetical protein